MVRSIFSISFPGPLSSSLEAWRETAVRTRLRYFRHKKLRGTQRFVSGNICSGDLNRLRNSDLIPVKTRDFFGETSPQTFVRNIYYLPAGRSVLRKTVPEVLSTARGRRPRAVLKTEGTVFLNTDRPRPANNIFIFFLLFFKS